MHDVQRRTWVRWLVAGYQIFAVITVVNFLIFVAVAWYLGGDAINGKIERGRYYLFGVAAANGGKVYHEVSEAVFIYSKWHVYSIFVTWPLLMAGGVVSHLLKRRSDAHA
jgi:hypothetical protein